MAERAEINATAVYEKGALLSNCIGFIDCTRISMSRNGGLECYKEARTQSISVCIV